MDPNQLLPNVTQAGVSTITTAILRWGPIEWMIIMMLATFGVGLLIDTVAHAINRLSPPVSSGSQPHQGGYGRGGGGYLND